MLELIIEKIIEISPSFTAIIGCIMAYIKLKKEFHNVKDDILSTKDYDELKNQLKVINAENLKLKKQISELLTKIDRIKRDDNEW